MYLEKYHLLEFIEPLETETPPRPNDGRQRIAKTVFVFLASGCLWFVHSPLLGLEQRCSTLMKRMVANAKRAFHER